MKSFRPIALGTLLLGLAASGCGNDDPDRPAALNDLDVPLSDSFQPAPEVGAGNTDVVYPRYDSGTVGDEQGTLYDVAGAQDVGRGDDANTSIDGGVTPGLDGGALTDNGSTTGPSDIGGD